MARTNRGGSVLGFSIAALIMAGLLIGSAYMLRQLTTQQTAVAQNETPQPSTKPDDNQPKGNNAGAGNQQSSSPSQNTNTGTASPPPSSDSTQTGQLPHTGPGSLLGSIAALGSLCMAGVSYARSRRPELSL